MRIIYFASIILYLGTIIGCGNGVYRAPRTDEIKPGCQLINDASGQPQIDCPVTGGGSTDKNAIVGSPTPTPSQNPTPTPTPTASLPPAVTAMNFNAGQFQGLNTIMLTGSNFEPGAKVSIGANLSAGVTVGGNGTTAMVLIPARTAGVTTFPFPLVVTNPVSGLKSVAKTYTYTGYSGLRSANLLDCNCKNCVTNAADGNLLTKILYDAKAGAAGLGCTDQCRVKYGAVYNCNNPPQP